MNTQPKVFVLVGPSGVGKDTLMNSLIERYPNSFCKGVTHTTRPIRPGEVEGVNYYYVTKQQFEDMLKKGEFIEHNYFNNNYYGTSIKGLELALKSNKIPFFVLHINSVSHLNKQKISANYIGILPPIIEVLRKRLVLRATESNESIQRRIESAKEEIELISLSLYINYKIINDDLTKAVDEFENKMIILYPNLRHKFLN